MATMQPKPAESIELKTDILVAYQANSVDKRHHAPERKQSWCLADREAVSGDFPRA